MNLAPNDFSLPRAVVSIGMFDGVHCGHRELLHRLRTQGRDYRAPTVVVTFDPHPRAVIAHGSSPAMLSTLAERLSLLEQTGNVDHCLVLPFDGVLSQQSADDFVVKLLVAKLGMRALVVGENFSCGQARRGDVVRLRALGKEFGYSVDALDLVPSPAQRGAENLTRCSSTHARHLVQAGDVRAAAAVLQRPHELSGTVASAPDRGAMHVAVPDSVCAPALGLYWGAARRNSGWDGWRPAILSVGAETTTPGRLRVALAPQHEDAPWAEGEQLSMRFLDRAAAHAAL